MRTNEVVGRSKKVIWFRSRERETDKKRGGGNGLLAVYPPSFSPLKMPPCLQFKAVSITFARKTSIGFEGRFCSEEIVPPPPPKKSKGGKSELAIEAAAAPPLLGR